jgi:hypothetical protein
LEYSPRLYSRTFRDVTKTKFERTTGYDTFASWEKIKAYD